MSYTNSSQTENKSRTLQGWWKLDESTGDIIDHSGKGNSLKVTGTPKRAQESQGGIVIFDSKEQSLGTANPVLRTDQSFSVVAWVRLDSKTLRGKVTLEDGHYAWTAVSQDSPTHSAFYLGARWIEKVQADGTTTFGIKWNFTISPVDGSETGVLEWQHAHADTSLDESVLDKWVMLVGVCDTEKRAAYLYIPEVDESGSAHVPDEWKFWQADGGLQLGRGRWLGRDVDQWPGSIGPVRVFSGVLSAEEAKELYHKG